MKFSCVSEDYHRYLVTECLWECDKNFSSDSDDKRGHLRLEIMLQKYVVAELTIL